jgi:hypothetical protein
MSSNPLNLAFRFFLELTALLAMGYWGWNAGQGWMRWILMLFVPLVAAAIWGVFRVDNDPGPAPVRVPGVIRLALELSYFGFSVWALYDVGAIPAYWVLAICVLVHYLISYDRIIWLLKR